MRDHFWYLEISSDSDPGPVATALKRFKMRVGSGGETAHRSLVDFSIPSARPFELDQVLDYLENDDESGEDSPVVVLGTCSKGRAVEHSWEQLGLNLFNLPWFESEKAFRYVHVSALWEETAVLTSLTRGDGEASQDDREAENSDDEEAEPDDSNGENADEKEEEVQAEGDGDPQIDFGKARDQLEWAYCHRFAQDVQEFVGHGNRDRFQKNTAEDVSDELEQKYEDWKGQDNRRSDHVEDCSVCGRLEDRITELISGGDSSEDRKRAIADLDSHLHKLAPAFHFDESPISGDTEEDTDLGFRCVVLLEDDPDVRAELRKALRELLLPSSEGSEDDSEEVLRWRTTDPDAVSSDIETSRYLYQQGENLLYVVEADNDESTERHRLCDEDGDDILDNLIDSEIPIVREASAISIGVLGNRLCSLAIVVCMHAFDHILRR